MIATALQPMFNLLPQEEQIKFLKHNQHLLNTTTGKPKSKKQRNIAEKIAAPENKELLMAVLQTGGSLTTFAENAK